MVRAVLCLILLQPSSPFRGVTFLWNCKKRSRSPLNVHPPSLPMGVSDCGLIMPLVNPEAIHRFEKDFNWLLSPELSIHAWALGSWTCISSLRVQTRRRICKQMLDLPHKAENLPGKGAQGLAPPSCQKHAEGYNAALFHGEHQDLLVPTGGLWTSA